MKKENRGITLVALVVTIIVLIILAGVSISLVLGQNGIVEKAKQGRDNYAEAARLENEQLANVDAFAMDIEDMIPVSQEPEIFTPTGTVSNMTNGEIEISATVSLTGDVDLTRTKYAFTTSNTPLGTDDETLYKDGVMTQANETIKKSKAAGTYYLHILVTNTGGAKGELISNTTATSQGKKDFTYTGNVQGIALSKGNYKLEVWGAASGNNPSKNADNRGGYSYGNLVLLESTQLYAYVGGKGVDDLSNDSNGNQGTGGGWNGGGSAIDSGGGGGATDIALYGTVNSTDWNNTNHLYSRIIVAGGAGCGDYSSSGNSCYGGGINSGGDYPATQTSAGNLGGFGYGFNKTNRQSHPNGGGRRRLVWWRWSRRIMVWI